MTRPYVQRADGTKARSMPVQKPHRSKQTYGTPWELIHAVEARWGKIAIDLAASPENAKAEFYFTQADDFLAQHDYWPDDPRRLCWLNPPFENIGPWAAKCAADSKRGANIVLLVPASIGAVWFADHVDGHARVIALRPRLTFEGCTDPYPKDCMVCLYGPSIGLGTGPNFETWAWK